MTTGSKIRVYELARDIGLPNKELLARIKSLGIEVNNHMSSLTLDQVEKVKSEVGEGTPGTRVARTATKKVQKKTSTKKTKTKAVAKTSQPTGVIRRRRKVVPVAPSAGEQSVAPVGTTIPTDAASASPGNVVVDATTQDSSTSANQTRNTITSGGVSVSGIGDAELQKQATVPVSSPVTSTDASVDSLAVDAADAAPSSGGKAASSSKAPMILNGPAIEVPGIVSRQKSVPAPGAGTTADAAETPVDFIDVNATPRSRFEAELERARERVAEREKVEDLAAAPNEAAEGGTDRGARPAVGSVIDLPNQRFRIAERAAPRRPAAKTGRTSFRPTGRHDKRRMPSKRGTGKQTQITTPAEHKRIIRMEDTIAISELAKGMGAKASDVLKKLWGMGMVGININASIDFDTAQILSSEFGYEVQNVAFKEADIFVQKESKEAVMESRSPVVTIMGHVDHGKTSLLDAIRKSRVASGESGGITQHIAAYKVPTGKGGDIVFLDTPGHAAFTAMRARGAQTTDIVVLVCAADDGAMPQTVEALNHAKDAKVSIIVCVNKCDLPNAEPEKARQQLAEHGLIPEEWGGETMYINVSAHTGEGIDKLLESIGLVAEMAELTADVNTPAVGTVIEAKLDRNRGPMATILVKEGTLRLGDVVVAGKYSGKVRAMLSDTGDNVAEAGPSTPIELLGLDGVPDSGETLNVADDERLAKQVVEHRRTQSRKKELAKSAKISLENLMEKIQEGDAKELKIVLKADVHGSSEALKAALVEQSTDKVKVNVIQAGVGGITETDVNLAKAGGAIVVGFHVRPAGKSAKLAEREGVEIQLYDVIYEAIEDVRLAMAGLLAPIRREQSIGRAEVRDTFGIPKQGTVAGCMVIEGRINRKNFLRVFRDSVQIYDGKIQSLRRFKDDTSEVKEGYECGIMVQGFNDISVGDVLEAYEVHEEAAKL